MYVCVCVLQNVSGCLVCCVRISAKKAWERGGGAGWWERERERKLQSYKVCCVYNGCSSHRPTDRLTDWCASCNGKDVGRGGYRNGQKRSLFLKETYMHNTEFSKYNFFCDSKHGKDAVSFVRESIELCQHVKTQFGVQFLYKKKKNNNNNDD